MARENSMRQKIINFPASKYFDENYPLDAAEWVPACCTAIANQNREAALTCLELWDGTTVPHSLTNVLRAAIKHGFLLIVKKVVRRTPSPDMVPWRELIACAVSDCRSTALLQFLKIEFLSAPRKENNSRELWRRVTKDVARTALPAAVGKGNCLVARICLRLSPLLALDSSAIIKCKTSPDMLWIIMAKLFEVSEGTTVWAITTREESLRRLDAVVSVKNQSARSPTTRAMAQLLIKHALVTFSPFGMVARGSCEFVLSLKEKYGVGGEMQFH